MHILVLTLIIRNYFNDTLPLHAFPMGVLFYIIKFLVPIISCMLVPLTSLIYVQFVCKAKSLLIF